uniref:PKD_channel domain-containing protein n=1 Tax=Macrostomum lignano TaxID=282301 RepID=A0A1I8IB56_9PLAT
GCREPAGAASNDRKAGQVFFSAVNRSSRTELHMARFAELSTISVLSRPIVSNTNLLSRLIHRSLNCSHNFGTVAIATAPMSNSNSWRGRFQTAILARLPWQLIKDETEPAASGYGSWQRRQTLRRAAKRRLALFLTTVAHLALVLTAACADRRGVEQLLLRRHLHRLFEPGAAPYNSTVAGFWRWARARLVPGLFYAPESRVALRIAGQPAISLALSPSSGA